MKRFLICAAALLLAVSAAACGSGDSSASSTAAMTSDTMKNDYGAVDVSPEMDAMAQEAGGAFAADTNGGDTGVTMPADNRKIIKDADVYMETTDFDSVLQSVKKQVSEAGGYVSASSLSNNSSRGRGAMITCRIPADRYDGFMNAVNGIGNVTDVNENTQDITNKYIDVEARLKSLKAQEARLLELMESASDLENLIAVQNQLTETQYQIDSYTSQMESMKDLISYSTVSVSISEVVVYTPAESNFGDKIASAFKGMLNNISEGSQGLAVWFVYHLPAVLIFAVIAAAAVIFIRRRLKKERARKALEPKIRGPKE